MKFADRHPSSAAVALLACCVGLPAPGTSAEPPAAAAAHAKVPATTMVIVEGVGPDVETARKDAYRAAVRQVLGTLVDSETLVENDQLVTDRVVVFSDGFVDKVEDVPNGVSNENGFVRLRVKAFVKAGKLADSLRANSIAPAGTAVTVADPRSVFAQALTEQERKANARELFLTAAAGYPANCFVAEVGQPKILEVNDGTTRCEVRVKVSVNQKAYDEFAGRLVAFLESGEIEAQGQFDVREARLGGASTPYYGDWFQREKKEVLRALLPNIHADRLIASIDRLGNSDSVQARFFEWPRAVFVDDYGRPGPDAPYSRALLFFNRTGRGSPLIFLQTGTEPQFTGRWFLIDPQATSLPLGSDGRDLRIADAIDCQVELRDTETLLTSQAITLRNFGHAANTLGKLRRFPAVYFAPGFTVGGSMGSVFEFTLPIAVPEAAFHKPRLTITAALSNVPKGEPKK